MSEIDKDLWIVAREIIDMESRCIEWGATAERSIEICAERLMQIREAERMLAASNAWLNISPECMPPERKPVLVKFSRLDTPQVSYWFSWDEKRVEPLWHNSLPQYGEPRLWAEIPALPVYPTKRRV